MPTTRQPHVRGLRHSGAALRIPAVIRLSLGLPLMALATAVPAQVPAGASPVNMEGMELTSIFSLIQQQRAELQNADPGQQTKQGQQQREKEALQFKETLERLQQKIKQQERTKQEQQTAQEQAGQQLAKREQQEQTGQQKTTKESQQTVQQEQEFKETLKQPQQQVKAQEQAKQEQTKQAQQTSQTPQTQQAQQAQQTKQGLQQEAKQEIRQELRTTSQSSLTPEIAPPAPPRQQLLALLGDGETSHAAPATPGEVAAHLALGQGSGAAAVGISAGGIATAPGGVAAALQAAMLAGAVASSSDTNTVLLQQRQEQAATNAAQQQAFAYVTANMVTPLASFPTSRQATYTGPVGGTLNSGASVSGTFQATVDFATIKSGAPVVPGSITFANGQGSTSFTLSLLGGYLGGSMSGTYGGQAVTGFVMNGRFYGPTGEQLAGSWSMQNGGGSLTGTGSYKAQR